MPATYKLEEGKTKDKVRLLISDVGGADGKSFLFEDEEIETFLALALDEDIRLAAAIALRAIASNEAQVSKRIKFLELSTDGPAVADSLNKLADKLEESVDDESEVDIATMALNEFNLDVLVLDWIR